MKISTSLPLSTLALSAAMLVPTTSQAQVSGNIGWVSDYVFRGIYQADSSAYVGFDYAGDSGFYAGTWWADVGLGTETDIYAGWQGGSDSLQFKAGYTGYRYLDDFDGDYDEINLGLYAGIFSLDIAIGNYSPLTGSDSDYVFTSVTLAPEKGPYYKYGVFSGDFKDDVLPGLTKDGGSSGDYFEIGYGWSFEDQGIDLSAALTYSSNLPVGGIGNPADYILTFGIKKNFEMSK
jgi:Bacterial protein of unknown function (Gcw_chp)